MLKFAPLAGIGRGKFLTSASFLSPSALNRRLAAAAGETHCLKSITQVRQVPASGSLGLVPRQKPGPVGITPEKTAL